LFLIVNKKEILFVVSKKMVARLFVFDDAKLQLRSRGGGGFWWNGWFLL
jgi:hypothetical protein